MPWFLSLIPLSLAAADPGQPIDEKAVDAIVQKALKEWRAPGVAVGIVRDGEVIYLKGHGVREVGGDDPVTPDTVFPLASCSKAFTSTSLAILVDEGKLRWDDPPRKYVPFFRLSDPLADRNVTIRDLLCHRTGLRSHDLLWYRAPWSPEEAVRRAGELPLDRPFRTAFQYQSTMFTAAGLVVSAAAGEPWPDFVRRRLLAPLDMTATTFTTTDAARATDRATGHRFDERSRLVATPACPQEKPDAAGSIHSTARDLTKWLRFQLGDGTVSGKRIVSARNLNGTHSSQFMLRMEGIELELHPETNQFGYGMAWAVYDYRGERLVAHAGAIDGFRAHLTMLPERRLGIVVLTNLNGTRMNLALSNSLVDHLLTLPPRDWNSLYLGIQQREAEKGAERWRTEVSERCPGTQPLHEARDYAGKYEHPAYGTIEITVTGRGLVWRWNSFGGPLEHWHYETFVLRDPMLQQPKAVFKPGASGEVAALHVQGIVDVEFRKVRPKD
jgi:CubicO group peptidase (beta-lactamase class C family)